MDRLFKGHCKMVMLHMLTWGFAKPLFLAIKLWGIEHTALPHMNISTGALFAALIISGFIDGFIFGLIDVGLQKKFTNLTFVQSVVTKLVTYFILGMALTIILVPLLLNLDPGPGISLFFHSLISTNLIVVAFYIFLITLSLQVFKVTIAWIHTHEIFEIFSSCKGQIEEERIFMFLDMKSSTAHAEKMGAEKYSLMIQDCFRDMTKAVEETKAEIYQYVGDEVIFTWKTSSLNIIRSIQHYFSFRENLRKRSRYYIDRYGFLPEFKAGIHHGKVVKAQVAVTRKSMAFYGDAINTASLIQGKCNELGKDLLVSSAIISEVPSVHNRANHEGTFQLRGKDVEINLFSISAPLELNRVHKKKRRVISQRIDPANGKLRTFRIWLNVF